LAAIPLTTTFEEGAHREEEGGEGGGEGGCLGEAVTVTVGEAEETVGELLGGGSFAEYVDPIGLPRGDLEPGVPIEATRGDGVADDVADDVARVEATREGATTHPGPTEEAPEEASTVASLGQEDACDDHAPMPRAACPLPSPPQRLQGAGGGRSGVRQTASPTCERSHGLRVMGPREASSRANRPPPREASAKSSSSSVYHGLSSVEPASRAGRQASLQRQVCKSSHASPSPQPRRRSARSPTTSSPGFEEGALEEGEEEKAWRLEREITRLPRRFGALRKDIRATPLGLAMQLAHRPLLRGAVRFL